jgi:DNA-binding response OmpR family regulator
MLTKPFSFSDLLARLQSCHQNSGNLRAAS